jgi:hypothetical protein
LFQQTLNTTGATLSARRLVLQRCRELVADRVAITRRPRMLTPRSALLELIHLARELRGIEPSTSKRKTAIEPRAAMVAQVAAETLRTLEKDSVLRSMESPLPNLLEGMLTRWSALPPSREPGDLAKLASAADLLDRTYAEDADAALLKLGRESSPQGLFALSSVCVAAVSELRARGWSDDGLRAWFDQFGEDNIIEELRRLLHKKPRSLVCFVPVSGWNEAPKSFAIGGMTLMEQIDKRLVAAELPQGPYLSVTLRAHDEADAAERAFAKARRVLDAVALVQPEIAQSWTTPIVGVQSGSKVDAFEVGRWRGSVEPLAATVDQLAEHDGLAEACRYRVQAMQLRDPMTRLSLLWLGLERLVTPSGDHADTVSALRYLVPRAMALSKVRAEIGALARGFERAELSDEARAGIPGSGQLSEWLDYLQTKSSGDVRQLASQVSASDLRLAQWLELTRAHMAGPKPERLTRFFEATRQRIEWQILRLHRAHDRIGTGEWPLAWVHDMSLHAHHYLTAILLTVMRDPERGRAAREVLGRRAAQYDLFLGLLEKGERRATKAEALLDPTTLVGKAKKS